MSAESDPTTRATQRDTPPESGPPRPESTALETPIVETWEFRLENGPAQLWPLLADTNRLNEALAMPRYQLAWREAADVDPEGGDGVVTSRRRMAQGVRGSRGLAWEESPFEWVAGQWWRFERRYVKGPLIRFGATLDMKRSAAGGALVTYALSAAPNGMIGRTLISSGYLRRAGDGMVARAEEADAFLSGRRPTPFSPLAAPLTREARAEIDRRAAAMAETRYANGADAALASMIAQAPISDLVEMRPRRLARMLDLSERAAVEACLAAASVGLLTRRFALLCPQRRRPVAYADSLAELPEQARSPEDEAEFNLDLAVNVEAVFEPGPGVRPLGEGAFCHSGPMSAPHIAAQQVLEPNERRALRFQLRPGGYRIRTEPLHPPAGGGGASEIAFDHVAGGAPAALATPEGAAIGGPADDGVLIFENHTRSAQVIALERREWRADALTGAELVALQAHRDLFPDDAPATPLRAGRSAFAAFAVVEGAGLFARLGDVEAARRLNQLFELAERFARERNGGLVRAGGERGLAAFLDPVDAVGFAFDLRAASTAVLGHGDTAGQALASGWEGADRTVSTADGLAIVGPSLGFGVAGGRAVAMKARRGLELSGFAQAMAERMADAAANGEIVVSDAFARDPMVSEMLESCVRSEDAVMLPGDGPSAPVVRAR